VWGVCLEVHSIRIVEVLLERVKSESSGSSGRFIGVSDPFVQATIDAILGVMRASGPES